MNSNPINSQISISLLLLVILTINSRTTLGQTGPQSILSGPQVVSANGNGLIYLILLIVMGINIGLPIWMWLYRTFLAVYVDKARKKVEEYQQRISERMSSAGRKISETMRV